MLWSFCVSYFDNQAISICLQLSSHSEYSAISLNICLSKLQCIQFAVSIGNLLSMDLIQQVISVSVHCLHEMC